MGTKERSFIEYIWENFENEEVMSIFKDSASFVKKCLEFGIELEDKHFQANKRYLT